jgi:hypothetical protein
MTKAAFLLLCSLAILSASHGRAEEPRPLGSPDVGAEAWVNRQRELTDCAAYFHLAEACLRKSSTLADRRDLMEIAETTNTMASVLGFRIGMSTLTMNARMKAALDALKIHGCADFSAASIDQHAARCALLINNPEIDTR